MGERVFVFTKKRQGKKVSQIIFYALAYALPVSQVTHCKKSTLIGLYIPPRSNSPRDIYSRFLKLSQCSSTMSVYALSGNCYCNCRLWCNPQNNTRLCTPYIRDVRRTILQPRDYPDARSVRFWTVWYNMHALAPGMLEKLKQESIIANVPKAPESSAYQGWVM